HSSPIYVKRNILASTFIPHPLLSQQDFSRFALDFLVFGNAFLELRKSVTGRPLKLEASPAKYTRRGIEEDVYWWVPSFDQPHPFAPGSVFHLLEPDINQELYGKPENVGSLGDIEKVAKVFVRNELIPLQDRMREVNAWAGQEVIRFKSYTLDTES
ncbi:TPA: hypothetical protein MM134_005395, partial [Klebsiella pneumoniae]|nr:hypothetical protein [Klebsiella pneumoniae]